jgi:hypothetical protein
MGDLLTALVLTLATLAAVALTVSAWFVVGLALSPRFADSVVEAVMAWCNEPRAGVRR